MNKVRKWLIEKLGGYPCQIPSPTTSTTVTREPSVRLEIGVVISRLQWEQYRSIALDIAKDEMASKLVQKMKESELLKVAYHETPSGLIECFMEVDIVPPKEV